MIRILEAQGWDDYDWACSAHTIATTTVRNDEDYNSVMNQWMRDNKIVGVIVDDGTEKTHFYRQWVKRV